MCPRWWRRLGRHAPGARSPRHLPAVPGRVCSCPAWVPRRLSGPLCACTRRGEGGAGQGGENPQVSWVLCSGTERFRPTWSGGPRGCLCPMRLRVRHYLAVPSLHPLTVQGCHCVSMNGHSPPSGTASLCPAGPAPSGAGGHQDLVCAPGLGNMENVGWVLGGRR